MREEEIDLIIGDILEVYGYDFSQYARASLKRRIQRLFTLDACTSFPDFQRRIRTDEDYFRRFVEEITVNVTEMFRDPAFYKALITEIFPVLATYPRIRIWHAGCATGEEVFSLAILLEEANLLQKTLLYATDINPDVVEQARKGIFPLRYMKTFSKNYLKAGGKEEFSTYYSTRYEYALMNERLKASMIFATHNLAADASFNEFQLILCRNVLIYFNKNLQEKVFKLLDNSLEPLGFLGLGSKETIRFSTLSERYEKFSETQRIWRKR